MLVEELIERLKPYTGKYIDVLIQAPLRGEISDSECTEIAYLELDNGYFPNEKWLLLRAAAL